jgi:class 3 adenylate cyclase
MPAPTRRDRSGCFRIRRLQSSPAMRWQRRAEDNLRREIMGERARAAASPGAARALIQMNNTTGDGLVATFDGPARAVRYGCEVRDASRELGLQVRCGIHTAEIEDKGRDITGIGVHVAARISQVAAIGEVWTSRTVKDLVSGSGITFFERGAHVLKGLDEAVILLSAER